MNTGRPRGLAAMLTLALSAGTVAGAGMLGSPAWAVDGLSGTYTLDSTSIWAGQTVTLTESDLSVDETPETPIVRTVHWGDGISTTLAADAKKATHRYPSTLQSWKVSVELVDGETTVPGTIDSPDVTVAEPTGTFKFARTWDWTWSGGGHNATLQLASVPANATKVWVAWGDGETSLLSRTTTSTTHYYGPGSYQAQVTLANAQGKAVAKATTNTYETRVDEVSPTVTLKVPSSPTKAASWKTVQGTAKDGQIGIDSVGVQLWKWTATKEYYYNFVTKKWVKYVQGTTNIPNAAISWRGVASNGVWKVGVAGLSKGYTIEVDYVAVDKAGNDSGQKWKVQKLTK